MITRPSLEDLEHLMQHEALPSISLYASMESRGPEVRKNGITYKNALADVERWLEEGGHRAEERERLLDPMRRLMDDRPFWENQEVCLVQFRSADDLWTFRLDWDMPSLVNVAATFHVKPLLRLLAASGFAYMLWLDLNETRLFEVAAEGTREIELPNTPSSLEEALRYDVPERSLQFHSKTSSANQKPAQGGRRPAIFHGQGTSGDDLERRKDIERFFRAVNEGVSAALPSSEPQPPLFLAGVEYERALFREVSHLSQLADEELDPGNEQDLLASVRALVRRRCDRTLDEMRQNDLDRFRSLVGTQRVSTHLREVLTAARNGRIDTLFVPLGVQRWGVFDPSGNFIERHDERAPGDVDLLDRAAVWTTRNGGTVHLGNDGEQVDGAVAAAILRY